MAKDEHDDVEQAREVNRRHVLAGGAASVASATLPGAAAAADIKSSGKADIFGAIYRDFRYTDKFNNHVYNAQHIDTVHRTILEKFPNRNDLKWGLYQRQIVTDPADWGTQAAYDNWPYFSEEVRVNLEKQPAKFTKLKNAMNPFDTSQVAANLLEHLDEVIRIALWEYAVPIKIKVGKRPARHHGLTTEWIPAPAHPGTNPHVKPNGLNINIDCPDGGWQGYAFWRNKSSTDHITKCVAKWQVPSAPANQEDQIIFIFNGLESVSDRGVTAGILQPVLQWTKADGWYIRSWYVMADFDPVAHPALPSLTKKVEQSQPGGDNHRYYSKAVQVFTGNTITATIEGGKDATGKFNYTCSMAVNDQPKPDTKLSFSDIPELVYAVCAVESYGITAKPRQQDYPANPITMSSIVLEVQQAPVTPNPWKTSDKIGGDFEVTAVGDNVEFKLA